MKTYETSATVDETGEIHLAGIPFVAGTEVDVVIKVADKDGHAPSGATDRAGRLFAALDQARNTESVGPLRREELYDREVLR